MDDKRVFFLRFTNQMSSRENAEAMGDVKSAINDFLKQFWGCEVLAYPSLEDFINGIIGEIL